MPRVNMNAISPASRAWVFGSSEPIDDSARLLVPVDEFLDSWVSHQRALEAACDLAENRFLTIAVDESNSASGCSIDKLFRFMGELEKKLFLRLLDSSLIFYRIQGGAVASAPREQFREMVKRGEIHGGTHVFDTTVESLEEIRSGRWEKPLAESWHQDVFGTARGRR